MTSTIPLAASQQSISSASPASTCATSGEQLGETIAELAARLHAATYELLVLLREFDDTGVWSDGFRSCAHWLSWRTGIDLGAARQKVRVAHALAGLPRISAAMERGELSYAKVRAITRVATPDSEPQLLDVARAGTAAHVETIRFFRPDGRLVDVAPAPPPWTHGHEGPLGPTVTRLQSKGVVFEGRATPSLWDGTPFDVGWVIDVLRGHEPVGGVAAAAEGKPHEMS